mmetsp:Transcript_12686/g.46367  ORF Transcript_12686/g.46367 Transcript_12686/m.46367 type:complete len:306 (+) Transcript_12686:594-1511(+)
MLQSKRVDEDGRVLVSLGPSWNHTAADLRVLLLGDDIDGKVVEDLCAHFDKPETPEWLLNDNKGKQENMVCSLPLVSTSEVSTCHKIQRLLVANAIIPGTAIHGPYYLHREMPDISAVFQTYREKFGEPDVVMISSNLWDVGRWFNLSLPEDTFRKWAGMSQNEQEAVVEEWKTGAEHFTNVVREAMGNRKLLLWHTSNNVHPRANAMTQIWHMPALIWNEQPEANVLVDIVNCATRELVNEMQESHAIAQDPPLLIDFHEMLKSKRYRLLASEYMKDFVHPNRPVLVALLETALSLAGIKSAGC